MIITVIIGLICFVLGACSGCVLMSSGCVLMSFMVAASRSEE